MNVQSVLIVEDDAALAATLKAALASRARLLCVASTLAEARARLDPAPEVVVLDFALSDGTADTLLGELMEARPLPTVIAMSGVATTEDSFRLARHGVRAYLQKPFDLDSLVGAWEHALTSAPDLVPSVRQAVGKVSLHAVEDVVRGEMIDEALAMSSGSRRKAASLLRISRQTLQHILKALPNDLARRCSAERTPSV